ncbi:MAG: nucleotide exchange factor GrpE, partial [Phycisphaerae bacterium]
VETEPDGIVLEELQKGYMIKGKVIRPAMVVVNKIEHKEDAPAPEGDA